MWYDFLQEIPTEASTTTYYHLLVSLIIVGHYSVSKVLPPYVPWKPTANHHPFPSLPIPSHPIPALPFPALPCPALPCCCVRFANCCPAEGILVESKSGTEVWQRSTSRLAPFVEP